MSRKDTLLKRKPKFSKINPSLTTKQSDIVVISQLHFQVATEEKVI